MSTMDEIGLDGLGARLAEIAARSSFALGDGSRMRLVGSE
jgi:hypothetical protein